MCKNPQVDIDSPAVAELVADVAAAVSRRVAAVSEDVYEVILREIPELRDDKPVLALLASSVHSNIGTCLQVMQHQIDLGAVRAPAAALEYARRRAQRGTPLTALLRAYRLGHARFSDWLLRELAQQADDGPDDHRRHAEHVQDRGRVRRPDLRGDRRGLHARTGGLAAEPQHRARRPDPRPAVRRAGQRERDRGHPGLPAAPVPRGRGVLGGRRGGRRRRHHPARARDQPRRGEGGLLADPVFLPRDESSAWAWLPLGIRDTFDAAAASTAGVDGDIHFAFGDAAKGTPGSGSPTGRPSPPRRSRSPRALPARAVAFSEVAPVAMMLGSPDLLRAWVLATLAGLAADDEHQARLRETLLVFLQTGGSYKATAERLTLHKNTVQYRIRKAEESLGRPVGENRHDVELALRASHWLGSSVLQPGRRPT